VYRHHAYTGRQPYNDADYRRYQHKTAVDGQSIKLHWQILADKALQPHTSPLKGKKNVART